MSISSIKRVSDDSATTPEISKLIATYRQGYGLERRFYTDLKVFEHDIKRVYLNSWLYAGHVSQIPNPGDYITFEIANESVILIRGEQQRINALVNVCRHRGSRICSAASGQAKSLVCPYHGWTYDMDGHLRAARHAPDGFDKSLYSLKRINVGVFHGLMFINFAVAPQNFETMQQKLDECTKPFGFDRAKIAHRAVYPIKANWKLAVENYTECYHCSIAHREYSKLHTLEVPHEQVADLNTAMMARATEVGLVPKTVDHVTPGSTEVEYFFWRSPLYPGHVSGSPDGKAVAPPLGDIRGYDGGATDIQIGPVSFFLAYSDYAVIYRFIANSIQETDCELIWLVNETAEEDTDYDLSRLTWLWDVTTESDKRIIEANQQGVNSDYYEPGPYSKMEQSTSRFIDWYLEKIG